MFIKITDNINMQLKRGKHDLFHRLTVDLQIINDTIYNYF